MSKYIIDGDEAYPVYTPEPVEGDPPAAVEIPDEFIERYNRAADEWGAVQGVLDKYQKESDKQYWEWLERSDDLPT